MYNYKKSDCEFLRLQSKQKFLTVQPTWIELGRWAAPHRTSWMLSQRPGERRNYHIVDTTHILSLRSYVAGFLEGNTSASRPWFRSQSKNPDKNANPKNREWLDRFTRICLSVLGTSNFYHAAGQNYYDVGVFNTSAYYIDETDTGLFFHVLIPGSYYVINNTYGEAVVLVREFTLTVKALVDRYGQKDSMGRPDWSNLSSRVRKLYEDGNYTQTVEVCQIVKENEYFDHRVEQAGMNRKWISMTYEIASSNVGTYLEGTENFNTPVESTQDGKKFLEIKTSRRKPFIVTTSERSANFEYGEKGPTLDALGCIKSLNKKAISKDQALEQILQPPTQGPASLRKTYISTQARAHVPLDATSAKQGGLKTIYETRGEGIQALVGDVDDLRTQVERLYYSDYLLFLSRNPKTRTAAETNAVVQEQQLIIGPNLQSLNWTHNVPVVEFVMDYVLDKYPYLEDPPDDLAGDFLRPEFISVFAQAQKAADLPNINQFMSAMMEIGQINPSIFDKVNLDKLADIYEDRLYLPAGLVNEQSKVDAQREQAAQQAQRQQALNETVPAVAGAARDLGLQIPQGE